MENLYLSYFILVLSIFLKTFVISCCFYFSSNDTIYFYRELLCHSLENLRIDLITISSFHGITDQEEPRFDAKLFPEKEVPRCRQFKNKRVSNVFFSPTIA